MISTENRVIHVRFDGKSWDLSFAAADVAEGSNDQEVRQALARYLDVPATQLAPYVVERHANGNITVRPEAIFG